MFFRHSTKVWGRVIVEAMACGKPVIASQTGGIPELIEDGQDGILVPPGDVQALAQAMSRFVFFW